MLPTRAALASTTLAPVTRRPLLDPATGTPAWVSSASPTAGPDGDVYICVLEAGSHNRRGWLLHYDAGLTQVRTPAACASGASTPRRSTR